MDSKIVAVVLLFIAGLGWYWLQDLNLPQQPTYISPQEKIPPPKPTPQTTHPAFSVIQAINKRNAQIKNFFYDHISVRAEQNMGVTLDGTLAYEKDKNFRMTTSSIMGRETDVGSNSNVFWFWSKRLKPPKVYYAAHSQTSNSRLKPVFHPLWIMESLSIDRMDTQKCSIQQYGKLWRLSEQREGLSHKPITKVTLIDPKALRIVGHYLYNTDGVLLMSTEIRKFYQINDHQLPKEIHIIWYEENVRVNWKMEKPTINTTLPERFWEMPDGESMDISLTESLSDNMGSTFPF